MFALLKSAVAAAMLTSALAPQAFAADMLEGEAVTPVEFGTGWYLRGEVGISVGGQHTKYERINDNTSPFSNEVDFSQGLMGGVAVGHNFTSRLRGEISASFLSSQDSSTIDRVASTNCPGESFGPRQIGERVTPATPAIIRNGAIFQAASPEVREPIIETVWQEIPGGVVNCSEQTDIKHNAAIMSANGFYDLAQVGRFTPFVGGGLGVARINYDRTRTVNCIPGTDSVRCRNEGNPFVRELAEGETDFTPQAGQPYSRPVARSSGVSYHAAGTVAAGVSYQISRNLHLDTNYAYTHIFDKPLYDGTDGLAGAKIGASNHQVKVGLRYEIW